MESRPELDDWQNCPSAVAAVKEAEAIAMSAMIHRCANCFDRTIQIIKVLQDSERYICQGKASFVRASGRREEFVFACTLDRRIDFHGKEYFVEVAWVTSDD